MPVESNLTGTEKWEFDAEVAEHFDDMLARSIPSYITMRKMVTDLTARFAVKDTFVVDLGCSRGEALAHVVDRLGAYNKYLGVEVSEPMRNAATERFESWGDRVRIENLDLRREYPKVPASVVMSVLTLMFVPIEYRQRVVSNIYDSLPDGGAFIMVEKVLGSTSLMDDVLVDAYYEMKANNGYSQVEIERKRLSLEGVLVPVTANWNVDLLERAGFRNVDCFWRVLNFAGWLAVK